MTTGSRKTFVLLLLFASACGTKGGGGGGAAGAGGGGAGASSSGVAGSAGNEASGGSGGASGAGGAAGARDAGAGGTSAAGAGGSIPGDASAAETGAAGATRYEKTTCPPGPFPTPAGSDRKNVCTTFKLAHNWNEGPVWIASQQAFFFSNFQLDATTNFDGDLIKYTPATDTCELWLANVGTNGLGIAADGNLLAAVNVTQSITEFDLATKQPKVIVDHYMGKTFNAPNDLIVHSNGTIYFTDPDYQRGNRPQALPLAVYRIDPAGVLSLIELAKEPNGITLSPDEKSLYVDQDQGGGLSVFTLDASGVPMGAARPFAGVTDGVAMDCAGDLYLSAAGGIVSPAGTSLGTLPGGGGTHATFGGADGKTLFVVGNGSDLTLATQISTIQMNLPGIQ